LGLLFLLPGPDWSYLPRWTRPSLRSWHTKYAGPLAYMPVFSVRQPNRYALWPRRRSELPAGRMYVDKTASRLPSSLDRRVLWDSLKLTLILLAKEGDTSVECLLFFLAGKELSIWILLVYYHSGADSRMYFIAATWDSQQENIIGSLTLECILISY
jgi:hypothetical protein